MYYFSQAQSFLNCVDTVDAVNLADVFQFRLFQKRIGLITGKLEDKKELRFSQAYVYFTRT